MEVSNGMKLSDFDYRLPPRLIAQFPPLSRTASRLLVVSRDKKRVEHKRFSCLSGYLAGGDCLVLNDTRVIPARLTARKPSGGRIEVLLLKEYAPFLWEALLRPAARVKPGINLIFDKGVSALLLDYVRPGVGRLKFEPRPPLIGRETGSEKGRGEAKAERDFLKILERIGKVPLPPYIKRQPRGLDKKRYQTVYARIPGAIAAPTAGLHFTLPLLEKLKGKGVKIARITLHVGYGTFKPVREEDISKHKMEEECYSISDDDARVINQAKQAGKKVFAVGTTTSRALESAAGKDGMLTSKSDWTDLFIYPPYKFKVIEGLLTNFHLPRTTLLMLVSAFGGKDLILSAYREAIAKKYRFYSYGDAMLIL